MPLKIKGWHSSSAPARGEITDAFFGTGSTTHLAGEPSGASGTFDKQDRKTCKIVFAISNYRKCVDRQAKAPYDLSYLNKEPTMDFSLDSVGKRVACARKYRSLTQQELADRAGIAQSSLASLEAGRNKGSRSLVSLAKALDVPAEWLDSGQNHEQIMALLRGNLHHISSAAEQSVQRMLKSAVPGEQSTAYSQSNTVPKGTEHSIGLKLLAWTARSLLDPDTAYKQNLEQQRRFQWPFPHSSRAFLLRATRNLHIPNLREDDFLLIEPDAPVLAGRDIVVVRSDDNILLGRVIDTPSGQFLLLAINAGDEELLPLDASLRVAGVIASRLQRF